MIKLFHLSAKSVIINHFLVGNRFKIVELIEERKGQYVGKTEKEICRL